MKIILVYSGNSNTKQANLPQKVNYKDVTQTLCGLGWRTNARIHVRSLSDTFLSNVGRLGTWMVGPSRETTGCAFGVLALNSALSLHVFSAVDDTWEAVPRLA